jgi:EAL domain-containing protein (putative c-di-GMP-specific phosphodiesterase class I)
LLRELGCAQAQGHLLAPPMPGNALVAWIRANRQRLRQMAS